MKLKLEDFIEELETQEGRRLPRPSLPSVADRYRKAYYSRPKLTLRERWALMWSNPCYPLSR